MKTSNRIRIRPDSGLWLYAEFLRKYTTIIVCSIALVCINSTATNQFYPAIIGLLFLAFIYFPATAMILLLHNRPTPEPPRPTLPANYRVDPRHDAMFDYYLDGVPY